ncbi:uncharacterized protein LOC109813610 [Cajanus cajan]|uniref:Seed maturation protein n=1 Tax=Cajanus cajan TaxID=3821 RepID=A0A151S2S7_CAJCA|nr:uncharacterized protein LOC109813610 [Cajanus cajan]KYP49106.1 hypothetical protein KK1_029136 [Cajanus cajan]
MAKSKDDIKYGTAQARLSEDEALRVAYKHGTPLEAGKIAESEPVDMFASAHNVPKSHGHTTTMGSNTSGHNDHNDNQSQLQRDQQEFTTGPPRLPQKGHPPTMGHKS